MFLFGCVGRSQEMRAMDVKSCVQQSTMLFARNVSRATWKKQLLPVGEGWLQNGMGCVLL